MYRRNWRFVRAALAGRGVAPSNLDDLTHEVFLVALRKLTEVDLAEEAERLWLGQIAHYVVAGHRRRAFNRREVAWPEHADVPDPESASEALVEAETSDLLHVALSRIDPLERDLLALHVFGDLSFRTLGSISDCDPKTARKKFLTALRRVRLQLAEEPSSSSANAPPSPRSVTPAPVGRAVSPHLQLVAFDDSLAIGMAGHVGITHWYGDVTSSSLEMFLRAAPEMKRLGAPIIGHLAMVEDCCGHPAFEARGRILDLLAVFRSDLRAYATVFDAHGLVYPIMKAMAVIARVAFPMQFVRTVDDGAAWLFATLGPACGLPSGASLLEAARALTAIRATAQK